MARLKVGVLISGRGSNLQALAHSFAQALCPCNVLAGR
jgi:folate-dependent phosphoribosylglycinamide formyltransferase PurN